MLVCERGTMFGYSDLVVDPRNFVAMRDAGCPVTADVTHALQQVGGWGRGTAGGGAAHRRVRVCVCWRATMAGFGSEGKGEWREGPSGSPTAAQLPVQTPSL